jgi:hypothetical protein
MSELFSPDARSIRVPVRIVGPRRHHDFVCVLDTGAARTVLSATLLRAIGFDLIHPVGRELALRDRAGAGAAIVR